ncbi:MAG: AraC family transcriptional regulator, partial [Bacteroidota bacterium]
NFAEKIIFERVIFKPPLKARENMQGEACFIYSWQGHSKLSGEVEKGTLMSKDGALMKCGRFLNIWEACPGGESNEVFVMHLYPEVLEQVYEGKLPDFLKARPHSSPIQLQVIQQAEAIRHFMEGLRFYFDNPSLADHDLVKIKIKELILLLYRSQNEGIRSLLQDLFDEKQQQFKEIIHQHLYTNLSLDDLAFLCNQSLSSFKRTFKTLFQSSPARYIREKKLEKAADLLRYSDKSISDICYSCGFEDPKQFAKNFKSYYHQSPTDYRHNPLN